MHEQPNRSNGSAFWDERYREGEYAYGDQPNTFLEEHAARFEKGAAVLSLAEGQGRNGVFLARQGCAVTGVDFSVPGRESALQLARKHGVRIDYRLADLSTYDMGDSTWDGIVSIFCHLSSKERPDLFASVQWALKPGGVFLLESYNKNQLAHGTGGPRDEDYLLSVDELLGSFDGWDIRLAREAEREIYEGQYHQGLSAVTQFIARKPR